VPTPDFVLSLREKIGHEPLWLSGVTAVVVRQVPDAPDQVLLVRRSDNGIDPGEEPAVAGAREVLEEADVVAEPESLVWVHSLPELVYSNGDRSSYLDLCFRFRYVSGTPFPADGENTEAAWFGVDALPELSAEMQNRIDAALAAGPGAPARFEF
jgi:8-oxo-dGTP pyrophosphatase MutT (NUDIX family)